MADQIIAGISHELATQDNAATAHPIFVVEQRRRIYGMDPQWFDTDPVWLDGYGDNVEATDEERAGLDAEYERTGVERGGWTRTHFVDIWEFVTPFFTRRAADAYIASNRHNLCEPRVLVHSGYRNREWQAVTAFLGEVGNAEVAQRLQQAGE